MQAEAGFDISYPTRTIADVIDAAEAVEDVADERVLTEEEVRQIAEGGAGLGFSPPALIGHLGVAVAPVKRVELGVRLASSGWRLGARYQLLEQDAAGVDLSAGFGLGTALVKPPIESALDTVTVDSYSRVNVDVPLTLGRHGNWYRWWVGSRFLYSRATQTMTVELPYDLRVNGEVAGSGVYVGGLAGAALGYRSVFVGPELCIAGLFGSVDVDLLGRTEPVDLDTVVVQPAFAVMGEF